MKSLNWTSAKDAARSGGASFASTIAAGVIIALLAGCGGGGGGGGGTQQVTAVNLTGAVTNLNGTPEPGKIVTVQGSNPLISTTTDTNGQFTLTVAPNQTITIEVQDTPPQGSSCTQSQMPADTTQTVNVGGTATQTVDIVQSAPPPPPTGCTGL